MSGAQIAFIPHGGGPMPLLGEPSHKPMVDLLKHYQAGFPKPEAIIVVSAHYEADLPTLTSAGHPSLLFDYYGFPAETYTYSYPAPGAPELASRIADLLGQSGQPARLDDARGYDHGVFVPLMLMYPDAGIPVIQLSLRKDLDPQAHFELGEALAPLAQENILLMGSGMSFHNMRAFRARDPEFTAAADAFHDWLLETIGAEGQDTKKLKERLVNWASAPGARLCHPREEHLIPLHVCAGFASAIGARAETIFDDHLMGYKVAGFHWS